jgi:hypothetical protein
MMDSCGAAGFAHGYGLCVNALLDKGDRRYLGFLVLPLLALIGAGLCWYIRKERRRTREASARFRDGMDEVEVQKRVGRFRLERLMGMERARMTGDAEVLAGGEKAQERKRLRELLLPSKRRKSKGDKEAEAAIEMDSGSSWHAPPPPYASLPLDTGMTADCRPMSSGHLSLSDRKRDTIPETQMKTADDGDLAPAPNDLQPPLRPAGASGISGKPRLDEHKERMTLRFADQGNRRERDCLDAVDDLDLHTSGGLGSTAAVGHGRPPSTRLSELWPDMKGRRTEGWV